MLPGIDACLMFSETLAEANVEELRRLQERGAKVVRLDAEHSSARAATADSRICQNLEAALYLAVGARVMLVSNLSVADGLVNGAVGTVEDIVWPEKMDPNEVYGSSTKILN